MELWQTGWMGTVQNLITEKLRRELDPEHLDVVNESHMHNVPPGSESHFKVIVVSAAFDGLMLVKRHRLVNGVLADELQNSIHALALHTRTPAEWKADAESHASPECLGGSKSEGERT